MIPEIDRMMNQSTLTNKPIVPRSQMVRQGTAEQQEAFLTLLLFTPR